MHKYYFSHRNDKRSFYEFIEGEKTNFVSINKDLMVSSLSSIAKNTIVKTVDHDNLIEVYYSDGTILVIDSPNFFTLHKDEYDSLLNEIGLNIVKFIEKSNIEAYKESIPKGQVPRVNRKSSKKRNGKYFLAGGLGLTLIFLLYKNVELTNNANKKQEENNIDIEEFDQSAIEIGKNSEEISKIASTIFIEGENFEAPLLSNVPQAIKEVSDIDVSLAFADRTRGIEGEKLSDTIDKCGSIIDFYSRRYGLSYDIECAQISQERPNNFNNPCQITYSYFVGETFKVPVYDENGFTGTYDEFTVTKEMLDSLEGNIMVGLAYTRKCVDRSGSYLTGLFLYNQGDPSLSSACKYFNVDIEDYKGDKNVVKARDLIARYYNEIVAQRGGVTHGDPNYLENVMSYVPLDHSGSTIISYYLGDELKTFNLTNTKTMDLNAESEYNSTLLR